MLQKQVATVMVGAAGVGALQMQQNIHNNVGRAQLYGFSCDVQNKWIQGCEGNAGERFTPRILDDNWKARATDYFKQTNKAINHSTSNLWYGTFDYPSFQGKSERWTGLFAMTPGHWTMITGTKEVGQFVQRHYNGRYYLQNGYTEKYHHGGEPFWKYHHGGKLWLRWTLKNGVITLREKGMFHKNGRLFKGIVENGSFDNKGRLLNGLSRRVVKGKADNYQTWFCRNGVYVAPGKLEKQLGPYWEPQTWTFSVADDFVFSDENKSDPFWHLKSKRDLTMMELRFDSDNRTDTSFEVTKFQYEDRSASEFQPKFTTLKPQAGQKFVNGQILDFQPMQMCEEEYTGEKDCKDGQWTKNGFKLSQ